MFERLPPRSMRTLRRKGFIVMASLKKDAAFWKSLDAFARHPAVLLVLTFILTGILGQTLTSLHEERQRNRESVVKSMDGLRSSIDDLTVSYRAYFLRSLRLIRLLESDAPDESVREARKEYQTAYYSWRERLAADMPAIKQRSEDSSDALFNAALYLEASSGFADKCIRNSPTQNGEHSHLVCNSQAQTIAVYESVEQLGKCVNALGIFARPDPRDDFLPFPTNDAAQALNKNCDPRSIT